MERISKFVSMLQKFSPSTAMLESKTLDMATWKPERARASTAHRRNDVLTAVDGHVQQLYIAHTRSVWCASPNCLDKLCLL